jgi:pimeloyl-ACP methyl ester carboxylesterase
MRTRSLKVPSLAEIEGGGEGNEGVVEKVNVPGLMISAEDDVVLPPRLADGMEAFVPDLEKHIIPACGHWTQQEKPAETNHLIIDWLKRRFG